VPAELATQARSRLDNTSGFRVRSAGGARKNCVISDARASILLGNPRTELSKTTKRPSLIVIPRWTNLVAYGASNVSKRLRDVQTLDAMSQRTTRSLASHHDRFKLSQYSASILIVAVAINLYLLQGTEAQSCHLTSSSADCGVRARQRTQIL
jgi:hypothetical protein